MATGKKQTGGKKKSDGKTKPKNAAGESIKDLEGLSDEELDDVAGGTVGSTSTVTCCKNTSCGGGCGSCKTEREANFKAEPGDVEFSPTKKL